MLDTDSTITGLVDCPFDYFLTFIWYLRPCVVGIYKITKHNDAMNVPLIVQNYTIFLFTSTQMTISEDVYCFYLCNNILTECHEY